MRHLNGNLTAFTLWDQTPLVQRMLKRTDITYDTAERMVKSGASAMWFGEDGGIATSHPLWLNNENYVWC